MLVIGFSGHFIIFADNTVDNIRYIVVQPEPESNSNRAIRGAFKGTPAHSHVIKLNDTFVDASRRAAKPIVFDVRCSDDDAMICHSLCDTRHDTRLVANYRRACHNLGAGYHTPDSMTCILYNVVYYICTVQSGVGGKRRVIVVHIMYMYITQKYTYCGTNFIRGTQHTTSSHNNRTAAAFTRKYR